MGSRTPKISKSSHCNPNFIHKQREQCDQIHTCEKNPHPLWRLSVRQDPSGEDDEARKDETACNHVDKIFPPISASVG